MSRLLPEAGPTWRVLGLLLLFTPTIEAQQPWPAEPAGQATYLTAIEGPGTNDFYVDLSGASWNASTRTLWLVRSGPDFWTSKMWAVVEDGNGGFEVDYRNGLRGEWTGFGDAEGVTQADWSDDVVYLILEGQERIREYDVSTYGTATVLNDWDTSPYLPSRGNMGAEGIAFVPDAFLSAAGFVDESGTPYVSSGGLGGLMFVGHQNGGNIYVFDLDRVTGAFTFVGEYQTGYDETAALEFDRSSGLLYVWHDELHDILSVLDLTSSDVPGMGYRRFNVVESYFGPSHSNYEGLALVSGADCRGEGRSLFMTIDDGGAFSLALYQEFSPGCGADTAFCAGDGSGSPCPCGNLGAPGEGCANSTGSGALLSTHGSSSVSSDDLTITLTQGPAGVPAIVFAGPGVANGGLGSPLGDGLLCVGGPIQRLGVVFLDGAGAGTWGPGLAPLGGWTAGETRHLQGWYRDNAGPCGGGTNTSPATSLTFLP